MSLTQLAHDIYSQNKEKGFWDNERNKGEMLMLITSELGEAMEAIRKGRKSAPPLDPEFISDTKEYYENNIKGSEEEEIADAIIRLLDYCGGTGIDIQYHVEMKLAYNKTRPHKHGKLF